VNCVASGRGRPADRLARPDHLPQSAICFRGSQYLSVRYTERLTQAGAVRSVGSRGDPYDNALAESVNGLYKTEVIRRRSWRSLDGEGHRT
jgi:hypothetical protein